MREALLQAKIAHPNAQQELHVIYTSRSWRLTSPLRSVALWLRHQLERARILWRAIHPTGTAERRRIRDAVRRRVRPRTPSPSSIKPFSSYSEWIDRFDALRPEDRALISAHISRTTSPELLVIWFLPPRDAGALLDAASSLVQQLSTNWSAILVSESPKTFELEELLAVNARLSVSPKITEAELTTLQAGYFLVIKGAGKLAEHATYMFGLQAQRLPGAVYCDEDVAGPAGRHSPRFAPAYSPEFPAIGSLVLLPKTAALAATLATTPEPEVYRTLLMISRAVPHASIHASHMPFILFHARSTPSLASSEIEDHLVDGHPFPKISIVIPTRNRRNLLEPCISSILGKTDYPRDSYRLVVVDNGSTDPEMKAYLDHMVSSESITLLRDPRPFNYSRLNNRGAATTDGELLIFVNNDTLVLDPLWLRRLAFHALKSGVGAVGAKLLYPDMKVQHGGIVLGVQGVGAHAHHGLDASEPGYMGLSTATHAISAVTGACLAVKRSAFREVGGFDENLAVAFSDVLFCIQLAKRGYRNVYIGHPLLVHFESRTRGYDDTSEKQDVFLEEARYARRKAGAVFKNDPYYNDNLSLERIYDLAFPPRVEKPWNEFRRQSTGRLRILMLSSTHQVGHGVPVVLDRQARHLAGLGHSVFVGGPWGNNDFPYPGCTRVFVSDPKEAAVFAVQHNIDCVVMHTPPFYSTARWLGASVKTLAYDYGEPNPDFFADAATRRLQLREKAFCLEMADALYAISDAVKAEAKQERMGVIPLGNSHLAKWDEKLTHRRIAKRNELGLSDRTVILNVCRFTEAERRYKGLDTYCDVKTKLLELLPEQADNFAFLLAGKGSVTDIRKMEALGLRVFANISDDALVDLYCCADMYANFSRWEGYNLGIGQALAMGLPVVASDIPAHRAFGVFVSNDRVEAAQQLVALAGRADRKRVALVTDWSGPLEIFSKAIVQLNFTSDAR